MKEKYIAAYPVTKNSVELNREQCNRVGNCQLFFCNEIELLKTFTIISYLKHFTLLSFLGTEKIIVLRISDLEFYDLKLFIDDASTEGFKLIHLSLLLDQ